MSEISKSEGNSDGKGVALEARNLWLGATDEELLGQCEVDRFRASGPGGQKRNKTESAVRLRHSASGVSARATESRSQHENKDVALKRLRANIAIQIRCGADSHRSETMLVIVEMVGLPRPSRAAGYLFRIAALLDMLVAAEMSLRDVADKLSLKSAAIARCLRADDLVRRYVNQERSRRELGPLR